MCPCARVFVTACGAKYKDECGTTKKKGEKHRPYDQYRQQRTNNLDNIEIIEFEDLSVRNKFPVLANMSWEQAKKPWRCQGWPVKQPEQEQQFHCMTL